MGDERQYLILLTGADGQDGSILSNLFSLLDIPVLRVVNGNSRKSLIDSGSWPRPLTSIGRDSMGLSRVQNEKFSVLVHLAASSSVADSVRRPLESYRTNTLLAIEAIEFAVRSSIPIIFPSSSEVFRRQIGPVDEETPHEPHTPYGLAKSQASELIRFYRQKGLLRGSILTMFNHESPLRTESYVTKTIVKQVMMVRGGNVKDVRLNSLSVAKDFSWAPELVALLALPKLWSSDQDYVLGSGQLTTVRELALAAADQASVQINLVETGSRREMDFHPSANPFRASASYNWKTTLTGTQMIARFVDLEMRAVGMSPTSKSLFYARELAQDCLQKLKELS